MSDQPHDHLSRETLSALVDGECGPEERRWAHDHLQDCDGCRDLMAEFARVRLLVAGLPQLVAPAALVADVLERGRAPARVPIASRKRMRWAAAAAAAVAAAVTLGGLAVPDRSEPPVDAFVTRHVSVTGGGPAGGHVMFAVTGP